MFRCINVSARVLRWSLELQRCKFEIQYVKNTANAVANVLSRSAAKINEYGALESVNEAALDSVEVKDTSRWLKELEKGEHFGLMIDLLRKKWMDGAVKLARLEHPVRVANFAIVDGIHKYFTKKDLCVLVVMQN